MLPACFCLILILAGCGQSLAPAPTLSTPSARPTVRTGPPRQAQQLMLSGDLTGTVTRLVLNDATHQNECTGANSRQGGTFAWTLHGYLGDKIYQFVLLVKPYRGPSTYPASAATLEVHGSSDQQAWQTSSGEGNMTITVDDSELTGTIEATLHNLASDQPTLQVKGRWSCEP
jgi:hypothetical protein